MKVYNYVSKSRAFGMLNPPKRYVVLKVSAENTVFDLSKRGGYRMQ